MGGRFLYPIFHLSDSMLAGTVSTAIKHTLRLHSVADDPAAAMGAGRRQGVDGTFEAIEDMRLTVDPNFKAFIVHIPTDFTSPGILLSIHDLPLFSLAFLTGGLGLPDILTPRPGLRRSWLGLLGNIPAVFSLEAITT